MDCTAWRFWTMRQPNGCSTPAPKSSASKQWMKELAQKKKPWKKQARPSNPYTVLLCTKVVTTRLNSRGRDGKFVNRPPSKGKQWWCRFKSDKLTAASFALAKKVFTSVKLVSAGFSCLVQCWRWSWTANCSNNMSVWISLTLSLHALCSIWYHYHHTLSYTLFAIR